jgi:hypothetical protein
LNFDLEITFSISKAHFLIYRSSNDMVIIPWSL